MFIMIFATDTACSLALFPLGLDLTKINTLDKYLYLTDQKCGAHRIMR